MSKEQALAQAIIDAAHILANNLATGPNGESCGCFEAHGMIIAKAIDGLALQFHELAHQMSRIADVAERDKNV